MCKLYTREEVIKLFEKLEKDRSRFYAEDASTIVPLDEWILENIPEDLEKEERYVMEWADLDYQCPVCGWTLPAFGGCDKCGYTID